MRVPGPLLSAAIFCSVLLVPTTVRAQPGAAASAVQEAERLRNAGDVAGAVRLLEAHVASHPADLPAIRLLAQSLYWIHDITRARTAYEEALRQHPDDVPLRLAYGRMLLELRDGGRLRSVLAPLEVSGRDHADVDAILGTHAYWEGDYTTARKRLRAAVSAGTTDPAARRQLEEIRAMTAAWIRVAPAAWHDDQPVDRFGIDAAVGWFPTPLVPVELRFAPERYRSDAASLTTWMVDGRISAYLPAARLEVGGGGGWVQRTAPEPSRVWTGLATAGVRMPHGIVARGRVQRSAYFNTLSSLATPVTLTTAAAQVHLDTRGWLGEAEHRRQRFFDDNSVRTSYLWVLAPILLRPQFRLQAGYAGATSTSDRLHFVPQETAGPATGLPTSGIYAPYHTPINQTAHSVAAALAFTSAAGAVVSFGGSAAVQGSEDAPSIVGGQVEPVLVPRDFSPWTFRASSDFRLDASWTITVGGETGRAAFYRWTTASIRATRRFGMGDRAERRR